MGGHWLILDFFRESHSIKNDIRYQNQIKLGIYYYLDSGFISRSLIIVKGGGAILHTQHFIASLRLSLYSWGWIYRYINISNY